MNEETVSNNPTYPLFSCASQRRAKSIIAVIQILVCFPDDAFRDTGHIGSINQQRIINMPHAASIHPSIHPARFRLISSPRHVFGLWEEAGAAGENLRVHV